MKLTKDAVKKVAKLANLPIPGEEEIYCEQLSKILEYIDHLNQVNTTNIEPTFNVTGLTNVMSEDRVENSLSQPLSLQNATSKNAMFVTKGVFEDE